MSRCFPYPRPGYALGRATKDALIESIKFQNERVKAKELKKESRKEKKEKRKEKKYKKSQNLDKYRLVQTQIVEKSWADAKTKLLPKQNKAETEQWERSGLTEEHDKPSCLRAPSTSSDSTENSNKRKRHPSSSDITCSQAVNKIIRIKLPLKKQKMTDDQSIEQKPSSTSGRLNVTNQTEDVICSRNIREQVGSTTQLIETSLVPKTPKKTTNKVLTPMQRGELQYQNLIDSLVALQPLDDADSTDWLLKGKNQESCAEKKRISANDSMPCSISWGLWPKAHYLQEVDVYALPFSVPF